VKVLESYYKLKLFYKFIALELCTDTNLSIAGLKYLLGDDLLF